MEEFPPPPPPPTRPEESYDGSGGPYADDGRTHFQERNYNDPRNPPPPPRPIEISSSQNRQSEERSVNTRSDGHHYKDDNSSFMSSFSKMDNERRREFNPYDRGSSRRDDVRIQDQGLSRGARGPPNRRPFEMMPPRPSAEGPVMQPGFDYLDGPMSGMGPGMMEEPYFYEEEEPMMMMMMEDGYFYDDDGYDF